MGNKVRQKEEDRKGESEKKKRNENQGIKEGIPAGYLVNLVIQPFITTPKSIYIVSNQITSSCLCDAGPAIPRLNAKSISS
jgi:hypothetical protein